MLLQSSIELWRYLVREHVFVIVHHAVDRTQYLIPVILNQVREAAHIRHLASTSMVFDRLRFLESMRSYII